MHPLAETLQDEPEIAAEQQHDTHTDNHAKTSDAESLKANKKKIINLRKIKGKNQNQEETIQQEILMKEN